MERQKMLLKNLATSKTTIRGHDASLSQSSVNKLYLYSIIFLAFSQFSLVASSISSSTPTTATNHGEQLSNANVRCPTFCTCTYQSVTQHLRITCDRPKSTSSDKVEQVVNKEGLAQVKQLTITNTVLDPLTVSKISQTIQENSIHELNLHQTAVDPFYFLSSDIFRLSTGSLRKIHFSGNTDYRLKSFVLPRGLKVQYFAELKQLESLTLQDSDAGLSSLILKTLPKVQHIKIVNSSLDYLDEEHFSHLSDLRSLNLSHNKIQTIPYGLSQHLPRLQILDVSHNEIEHLQEEVFVGLRSLRALHVNRNKIRYVDTEVFNPLTSVELIDLSHNEVIQIFEPYFRDNSKLKTLRMADTWSWDSFIDNFKGTRSFTEMEKLLATLSAVESLDLSDNEMIIIPETLSHVPQLKRVNLGGNPWECTCEDRWVEYWLRTRNVSIVGRHNIPSTIFCHSTEDHKQHTPFASYMKDLNCSNPNIIARTPFKYYGIVERFVELQCHTQGENGPRISWITPSKQNVVTRADMNTTFLVDTNLIVREDGTLFIKNIDMADFGLYLCIASYPGLNITHYIHLGMDTSIFLEVKLISILVGFLTSFCFLFTVLLIQLIRLLLGRCGIDCMTSSGPSRTRRVKAFFESIEQNNTSQLDWLRDNYNMQAKRIKDNCVSQLERIRESYTCQTKNLWEIKDYGAQQLHTIRDQYSDQIRRVSTYSSQHLCKVRENYVFQRNRVCKFSSHQMLRLRETYKWQAQTLNKILENLPKTLNFDTCRGMGSCGRADSMYLDEIGELRPMDMDMVVESGGFENTLYIHGHGVPNGGHSSGLSDKLEHVSLLIPSHQMQRPRFGEPSRAARFILPENIEATELVVVVTKPATHSTPVPTCSSSNRYSGAGAINECVTIEEVDEEEEKETEEENVGDGDAKC